MASSQLRGRIILGILTIVVIFALIEGLHLRQHKITKSDTSGAYKWNDSPQNPRECSEKAVQNLIRTAGLGDGGAQLFLAGDYAEGYCVKQSFSEAAKWYHRAAEQPILTAYLKLAKLYSEGLGVPRNYAEAYFWLELNMDIGGGWEPDGWLLKLHDETEKKLSPLEIADAKKRINIWSEEADAPTLRILKTLQELAEQGDAEAEYLLGERYKSNRGVEGYAQGQKWQRMAADRNYPRAQFMVGVEAEIPHANYAEACFWYSLAQKGDPKDPEYKQHYDRCSPNLTQAQQEQIDKRLSEWKPTLGPVPTADIIPLAPVPMQYGALLRSRTARIERELVSRIKLGVREAEKDGAIEKSDYEKLDFAFPADPGFGNNPEYELLNAKGPRNIVGRRDIGFSQALIDDVTNTKGAHPFLNLRRQLGYQEKIWDTLYFVIPDVRQEVCDRKPPPSSNAADWYVAPRNLEIPPNNSTVVTDAFGSNMRGVYFLPCNRNASGEYFLFFDVASRHKGNTDMSWAKASDDYKVFRN